MCTNNIVAQASEICKRAFRGWKEIPKDYKTRAAWKRAFRRVAKGEKPTGVVVVEEARKFDSFDGEYKVEKTYNLYHISQTTPIRKTALNLAQHEFFDCFGRHADRNKLIRWTQGEWTTDDQGEKWWDESAEVWGWKIFQEHFSLDQAIDHLNGKDMYGVFGAEKSCYLLIDLDLHNRPLDLFLRRLRVLLDVLWGRWRCHFQVSNEKAGGVHIILFFGKQSPLATRRGWLLNELAWLDDKYPGVEFTKVKGGKRVLNIEVYPSISTGHRLPLCRGRTMLLDKPLPLIKRRGQAVQDVVGYIKWLHDRDRQYMDKDQVFDFVVQKLDLSCSSDNAGKQRKQPPGGSSKTGNGAAGRHAASLPMKGRTRGAIIGFWLRGEAGHFAHLNAAIAVTLRALYFEGLTEDEAVDLVINYVDKLTNLELSSRLVDNKSAIHDVIRRDAMKIWDNNGGQANNAGSTEKWRAVIERWQVVGFWVSDKTTWSSGGARLGTVVDCEDFEFTEEEKRLLVEEMAPVLVGAKQAHKEAKQQEVVQAVEFFLRYVKCHDGEISVNALPVVLRDFSLNLKNHDKQQKFFDLLREWGWIYVRADYYHPDKHGGSKARGRARAYGIGSAMAGKFKNPLLYHTPQPTWTYILSPIFSEALPDEVEVPCFEDYFASLDSEFSAENQEIALEGGGF